MIDFGKYDTVEITRIIEGEKISLRGILIITLRYFASPNSDYNDGVYILTRVGKFILPIKVGHIYKILPCRIVLFEKVTINKKGIEKLREICLTRKAMVYVRRLEELYQD